MGVTIQEDMLAAARLLPDDQGRDLIWALVTYGTEGEAPSGEEPWYPMWLITKGRIEQSVKRNRINAEMNDRKSQKAAERKTQRDNPKGEPKGNYQRDNPKGEPTTTTQEKKKPNPRQSPEVRRGEDEVRYGEYEVGREESEERGATAAKRKKRFAPPSPAQVQAFADEQGLAMDAADYCDYYESVGWTVGRNKPMKDWRAAARRWAKSNFNAQAPNTQGGDPDDYYDFSALDRRSDVGNSDADLPF